MDWCGAWPTISEADAFSTLARPVDNVRLYLDPPQGRQGRINPSLKYLFLLVLKGKFWSHRLLPNEVYDF